MADVALQIRYTAEPTVSRFHKDESFFRGIMGPIGSGKSVACCMEILIKGLAQAPDDLGRRRTRWAVIRNTYPELKSTTIKTWQEWFTEELCPITFGAPITGRMVVPLDDGTKLDIEVFFLALDKPKDVKKLLSLELTGFWVNEAREVPKSVIDAATGRVGRFPKKTDGGPTWSGGIADTNPPDDTHWWYRAAEEDVPDGWAFYRQPAALLKLADGTFAPNVAAENVRHQPLGYEYWTRQVPNKDPEWIRVYVMGDYGTVMDGKPIYAGSWNDRVHVSEYEFVPLRGRPLLLGWDFGRTPACVIAQLTVRGQLRILMELVGEDIGVIDFAEGWVLPVLNSDFNGHEISLSSGDPAGKQKSDRKGDLDMFAELKRIGIPTEAAPSNDPLIRWEAVRRRLGTMLDGEPALQLSPTCRTLRKGFNGGYRYRTMQVGGEERFSDKADKNIYSHPHDALQYLCLALYRETKRKKTSIPRSRVSGPADAVAGY